MQIDLTTILLIHENYIDFEEILNKIKEQICEKDELIIVNLSSHSISSKEENIIVISADNTNFIENCMKYVNGKNVIFLDQNCVIEDNMYDKIHEFIISNSYDLITFNYLKKRTSNSDYSLVDYSTVNSENFINYDNDLVNIIFNKEFLENNSIDFFDSLINSQLMFFYESFLASESVLHINEVLLKYQKFTLNHLDNFKSLILNYTLLQSIVKKQNDEGLLFEFNNHVFEKISDVYNNLENDDKEYIYNYYKSFLETFFRNNKKTLRFDNFKIFKNILNSKTYYDFVSLNSYHEIKLSVIIPVFNSEKYLKKCINSVLNQNLQEIEIICIDDGSIDSSFEILKSFSEKDDRIKVYQNDKNSGAGYTRNRGINLAKGEYITFVDSDDWVEPEIYERLYNEVKLDNLDIVMFPFTTYDENEKIFYQEEYYSLATIRNLVKNNIFNRKDLPIDKIFRIAVNPFNKLYKRNFIVENNLYFHEGLTFEDNVFFFKVYYFAKKIKIYPMNLYYRRRHSSSVMGSFGESYIHILELSTITIEIFKDMGAYEEYKKELLDWKLRVCYMHFDKIKPEFKELFYKKMHEDYLNIKNDEMLYDDFVQVLSEKELERFNNIVLFESLNEYELNKLNKKLIQENEQLKNKLYKK